MPLFYRILIAAGIVLLDGAAFFLPLSALFLAYILLANPPWFRNFLERLDTPRPPEVQP